MEQRKESGHQGRTRISVFAGYLCGAVFAVIFGSVGVALLLGAAGCGPEQGGSDSEASSGRTLESRSFEGWEAMPLREEAQEAGVAIDSSDQARLVGGSPLLRGLKGGLEEGERPLAFIGARGLEGDAEKRGTWNWGGVPEAKRPPAEAAFVLRVKPPRPGDGIDSNGYVLRRLQCYLYEAPRSPAARERLTLAPPGVCVAG